MQWLALGQGKYKVELSISLERTEKESLERFSEGLMTFVMESVRGRQEEWLGDLEQWIGNAIKVEDRAHFCFENSFLLEVICQCNIRIIWIFFNFEDITPN